MAATSTPLEIQVSVNGGARTIHLTGELDIAGASELRAVMGGVILDASAVLIDLQRLEFIDSTGLRCLLACQESCARTHTGFSLTPSTTQVMRLFEVTGVLRTLPFAT